jgi:DNA-binding response OmpR family regulator
MTAEAVRTLVVDDEAGIRFFLQEALHKAGYAVTAASSGEEALKQLEESPFDLIVLDLILGGRVDGQRVLEAVRWRWPETVVVILTAHGSFESALAAIDEGVDGYLLKPAKQAEVLQTLEAALERREKQVRRSTMSQPERLLERGPFSFDLQAQQFTLRGQPVALTPNETRLLVYLMQNARRVISAKELVRAVLQYDVDSLHEARQIIKWYVHCLRRKVEADPSSPRHILNVRGVGYMFEA